MNIAAGICCCSDGRHSSKSGKLNILFDTLHEMGIDTVLSSYIYDDNDIFVKTAQKRAEALQELYDDERISVIFDISGGDLANSILPFIDYGKIAESGKMFWGYSDLTSLINAIYTKTGRASVLYQVRNIINNDAKTRRAQLNDAIFGGGRSLFDFEYEFIRGSRMEGVLIGGNIRCFLKLAGTEYFPDTSGKIILLEANSGNKHRIAAYMSQLEQIGVFSNAAGVLLGTFTELDSIDTKLSAELLKCFCRDIPIAKTKYIGHGADSKAALIGGYTIISDTLMQIID